MKMVFARVGLNVCESQPAKSFAFKPRLQIDADLSGRRVGVAVFVRTDIGITGASFIDQQYKGFMAWFGEKDQLPHFLRVRAWA